MEANIDTIEEQINQEAEDDYSEWQMTVEDFSQCGCMINGD